MNKLLLTATLFFVLLWSPAADGQKLLNSPQHSRLTYYYKIDDGVVYKMLKSGYYAVNEILPLATLVDSLPSGIQPGWEQKNSWGYGHYIALSVVQNTVKMELVGHQFIEAVPMNNEKDLIVKVYDKRDGHLYNHADVRVNRKKIPWNEKMQAYLLPKANAKGILSVSADGHTAYFELQRSRNNPWIRRAGLTLAYSPPLRYLWLPFFRRWYHSPDISGYAVCNKPKYLPGDTVKLKAFLIHRKGKPYNGPCEVTISGGGLWEKTLEARLSPVTKGAYVYEFVIGDSLKANYTYTINFSKGGRRKISASFMLEDYQLDEVHYTARALQHQFFRNDTVQIVAAGTDANGMLIGDGRVMVTVKPGTIKKIFTDTAYVKDVLWEKELSLNPADSTRILIPTGGLPEANLPLTVRMVFNNANNETHDTTFTLYYFYEHREIITSIHEGYVQASYKENGQFKPAEGYYEQTGPGERTEKKQVHFPVKIKADQHTAHIRFSVDSIFSDFYYSGQHGITVSGYRTHDSVFFKVNNPNKLLFTYTILKGGVKITERSTSDKLDWHLRDRNKTSYRIECQFINGGAPVMLESTAILSENLLNVELIQPEKVYPGEQADISVRVSDYKGNPVKDVNLTVYGINSQFGTYAPPDVPVYGKSRLKKKHINRFNIDDSDKPYLYGPRIDSARYYRMGLDTILYYQMLYPGDGYFAYYDSTGEQNAQVSPFLVKNGRVLPVYMLYMDGHLFYYYNTYQSQKYYYCMGTEGYHSLKLRTKDAVYYIDSVYLRTGYKLDLSVDVDHLPRTVKKTEAGLYLDQAEMKVLRQSILMVDQNYAMGDYWFWQKDRIYKLNNYEYGFKMIGPVMTDSLHVYNTYHPGKITSSVFEYGYTCKYQWPLVKMYNNNFFTTRDHTYDKHKKGLKIPWKWEHGVPFGVFAPSFKELDLLLHPPQVMTEKKNEIGYLYPDFKFLSSYGVYMMTTDFYPKLLLAENLNEPDHLFIMQCHKGENGYRLPPGYYKITVVCTNGLNYTRDSVHVRKRGTFYDFMLKDRAVKDDTISLKPYLKISRQMPVTYREHERMKLPFSHQASCTGKITDMWNVPVPLAEIKLRRYFPDQGDQLVLNDGPSWITVSTPEGLFAVEGLPEGTYRLEVLRYGYVLYEKNITLISGQALDMGNVVADLQKQGYDNEHISLITGGVPGRYGDVTGGVINMYNQTAFIDEISVKNSVSLSEVTISKIPGVFSRNGYLDIKIPTEKQAFFKNKYIESDTLLKGNIILPSDNPEPSGIRSNFTDYAYWQPNLVTDKNGEARFHTQFPDNVTGWKCYALAMDGHRKSGTGYTYTKAYKELLATLSVPRFMIEGDESYVIGKLSNYSGIEKNIQAFFEKDGRKIKQLDTAVTYSAVLSYLLKAGSMDSLTLTFTGETANGYYDGEKRVIPVYRKGTEETVGHFWKLSNDTTIRIRMDGGEKYFIAANDNVLTDLLLEVEDVKRYPYYCMEQTASKLKVLIAEKNICKWSGRPFQHEAMIHKMIKRLEKNQRVDGSWGWWENSPANVWMTTYITDALKLAKANGYVSPALEKSVAYLERNLGNLKSYELMGALTVLSGMTRNVRFETFTDTLEKIYQPYGYAYEKLQLLRIRQMNGLPYDIALLDANVKRTMMGNLYWGTLTNHWYDNSIQHTILAYQIIEAHDSTDARLPLIRDYFLELRSRNQWRNTIEKASILEVVLPALLHTPKEKIKPVKFSVSGTVNAKISEFPFTADIDTNVVELSISKSGTGPGYFTVYEKKWNPAPQAVDSLYKISSAFFVEGKEVETLTAGVETELRVVVEATGSADYVMIEIPVPAGCSYGDNTYVKGYNEIHREYLKNKVSVFCEKLSAGRHIFAVKLEPRFTGRYTLNPVRAELMYFPTIYGRNAMRSVELTN